MKPNYTPNYSGGVDDTITVSTWDGPEGVEIQIQFHSEDGHLGLFIPREKAEQLGLTLMEFFRRWVGGTMTPKAYREAKIDAACVANLAKLDALPIEEEV